MRESLAGAGGWVMRGLPGGPDVDPGTDAGLESSKKFKCPSQSEQAWSFSLCLNLRNVCDFSCSVKITPFYVFPIFTLSSYSRREPC